MKRTLKSMARIIMLLAILGGTLTPLPAVAAVANVSAKPPLTEVLPTGDPKAVAVSLANGFPLWYGDGTTLATPAGPVPLKLQLCTDSVLTITPPGVIPAVTVNPCEYEPPLFGAPPSFPNNFGAEAIYWSAVALGSYTSTGNVLSSALLVLSLEATGANGAALVDGTQTTFSRTRIRIVTPVAGKYLVTHPFGSGEYLVTLPQAERGISQTQDLGLATAQDFLVSMNDGPAPAVPFLFDPSIDIGVVNETGATIGPFLVPAAPHNGPLTTDPASFVGGPITHNGVTYLALPFAPPNILTPTIPTDVFQPVLGSPTGNNFFRIELREILLADGTFALPDTDGSFALPNPDGTFNRFFLNAAGAGSQVVQFDNFLIIGKVFNDGPNLAPTAVADTATTAANRPVNIDVTANDTDVTAINAADNVHGINPQAIALADVNAITAANPNGLLLNVATGMPILTATQPTTAGGTVRRVNNLATGKATFLYTPPPDFFGTDTFQYVVQDSGGLISAPATVSILVENLQIARADFRTRTGKWHVRGSSSITANNTVTLFAGPRARLTPDAEVQLVDVISNARGNATVRLTDSSIELTFKLDPLPATPITAAHIHVGAPGSNGPVIFTLFNRTVGIPFVNPMNLTLDTINLQRRPEVGVSTIEDAVNAILSGNAYINVHTTAFPEGELRGQFIKPRIGSAVVGADGNWELRSPSIANPGALPSIIIESEKTVEPKKGVRILGTPLRRR